LGYAYLAQDFRRSYRAVMVAYAEAHTIMAIST